jgi:alkylated DNA repair dioxygenase AlkB
MIFVSTGLPAIYSFRDPRNQNRLIPTLRKRDSVISSGSSTSEYSVDSKYSVDVETGELRKSKHTLEALLEDSDGIEVFRDFLAKEFATGMFTLV